MQRPPLINQDAGRDEHTPHAAPPSTSLVARLRLIVRNLLLAGPALLYLLFYRLPRYVFTRVIPRAWEWLVSRVPWVIDRFLVRPLARLFDLVGRPLLRLVHALAEVVSNLFAQLMSVIRGVAQFVARAGEWLVRIVLRPLIAPIFNALRWVVREAVLLLAKATFWLVNEVLTPLSRLVVRIGQWVVDRVITPLAKLVKRSLLWVLDNVLFPLLRLIGRTVRWLVLEVCVPLDRGVRATAVWVLDSVLSPLFRVIWNVCRWVWSTVLHPATSQVAIVAAWMWANVVAPAGDMLNTYLVRPTGAVVAEIVRWSGELVQQVGGLVDGIIRRLPF